MHVQTDHGQVVLSELSGERLLRQFTARWPMPVVALQEGGPARYGLVFQIGEREAWCMLHTLPAAVGDDIGIVLGLLQQAVAEALAQLSERRMPGLMLPCACLIESPSGGITPGLAVFTSDILGPHGPDHSPLADALVDTLSTTPSGALLPPFSGAFRAPRLAAGAIKLEVALVDGAPLCLRQGTDDPDELADFAMQLGIWARRGVGHLPSAPSVPMFLSEDEARSLSEPEPVAAASDAGATPPSPEPAPDVEVAPDRLMPAVAETESFDTESFDKESFDTESFDTESFDTESLDAETGAAEPFDAEPLDAEPHHRADLLPLRMPAFSAPGPPAAPETADVGDLWSSPTVDAIGGGLHPIVDSVRVTAGYGVRLRERATRPSELVDTAVDAEPHPIRAPVDRVSHETAVDLSIGARDDAVGGPAALAALSQTPWAMLHAYAGDRAHAAFAHAGLELALNTASPQWPTWLPSATALERRGADIELLHGPRRVGILSVRLGRDLDPMELCKLRAGTGDIRCVAITLEASGLPAPKGWTLQPVDELVALTPAEESGPIGEHADFLRRLVGCRDALRHDALADATAWSDVLSSSPLGPALSLMLYRDVVARAADGLARHGWPRFDPDRAVGSGAPVARSFALDLRARGDATAVAFCIVDPASSHAYGVRAADGRVLIFAEAHSPDRLAAPLSIAWGRRNEFLRDVCSLLQIDRSCIEGQATDESRAVEIDTFELLRADSREHVARVLVETAWVLWERSRGGRLQR